MAFQNNQLDIFPSPVLIALGTLLHLLALTAVVLAMDAVLSVMISVLVVGHWVVIARRYLFLQSPKAVRKIIWSSDAIRVLLGSGEIVDVTVGSQTVLWPSVILLVLEDTQNGRLLRVPLLPGSADRQQLRRLWVAIKYKAPGVIADSC
ncbi:MAG: hypothetical protein OQK12_08585 [Motiliproteus sp.]|nr:hypothetical protein [Motiliproteus sp.]MCW9050700.1 hypothetical protein [Motiliproteus sp.]